MWNRLQEQRRDGSKVWPCYHTLRNRFIAIGNDDAAIKKSKARTVHITHTRLLDGSVRHSCVSQRFLSYTRQKWSQSRQSLACSFISEKGYKLNCHTCFFGHFGIITISHTGFIKLPMEGEEEEKKDKTWRTAEMSIFNKYLPSLVKMWSAEGTLWRFIPSVRLKRHCKVAPAPDVALKASF